MRRIVGIAGKAGVGKDTVADYLVAHHGFTRVAFADPIRDALAVMLSLPVQTFTDRELKEKELGNGLPSPRRMMQLLGTEWGRNMINPALWTDLARWRIKNVQGPVVIPDVRYANEAMMIHDMDGLVIEITRDAEELLGLARTHASENTKLYGQVDVEIENTGTLDLLYAMVDQALDWNAVKPLRGALTLGNLMDAAHTNAKDKGFWDETPRNKGEMISLMHSELSEMLEGVRKPGPDDHCPEFTSEEVELADLLIRTADYAAGHDLRLEEATRAKMKFNATRPHKHGKQF